MSEATLEFKARDGAWYAGTASFDGRSLRVHFEHFADEEDEFWSLEKFKCFIDIRKMIRPASQPLQDWQCGNLRRGMFLCVIFRHPGTEFFEYYDAKLQQIKRSPHTSDEDGEEVCECKFEVEWLGGPQKYKRQFVGCGDICLRIMGNIEDDSVIKEYIEAVQKNTNTLEKEESSITGFKSLDANLTHDENSNQTKESSNVDDEPFDQQPDKKICLGNTWSRSLEPSITTNNVQGPNCFGMKQSFDVIDIESDNEEGCKSLRNASGIELPTGANDSGTSCSQPDVQTVSQEAPPLDEEHNTHVDCSGILKEQTLPHVNGMATCSCLPMSMHCVHGVVCQCQKAGFMQGTPFHQMNASSLNDYGHGEMNKASKWQNGDNAATDSATSQVCSKKSHSQAEQSARILHYDLNSDLKNIHHTSKTYHGDSFSENVIDNGDRERTHEVRKVNSKQYFYKGSSHHVLASQVLLVKNLEKDIIPSKALQVVREVTSGALLMYVWPAMDYETTKKGYIYYEDSESAKAAYEKFSAGLFLVASSKGRPWIVSQVPTKQIDQLHLHHILSAVGLRQEDETEEGEGGCGHLLILHRGSQEFPFAKAKLKLFLEQQKKLQCHYKIFRDEEDLLLAQQREL